MGTRSEHAQNRLARSQVAECGPQSVGRWVLREKGAHCGSHYSITRTPIYLDDVYSVVSWEGKLKNLFVRMRSVSELLPASSH